MRSRYGILKLHPGTACCRHGDNNIKYMETQYWYRCEKSSIIVATNICACDMQNGLDQHDVDAWTIVSSSDTLFEDTRDSLWHIKSQFVPFNIHSLVGSRLWCHFRRKKVRYIRWNPPTRPVIDWSHQIILEIYSHFRYLQRRQRQCEWHEMHTRPLKILRVSYEKC